MFKCTLVGAYEEAGVLTKLNVACKKYARIQLMKCKLKDIRTTKGVYIQINFGYT